MKGILIFDSLNDVVYFDVDLELSHHIQKLAIKDGLLEIIAPSDETTIDKNVVMQLFSPLIASYKVMQGQFGNKYKFIESEDGVILVFDDVLNYVVVSICNEGEQLEEMQKELSLFSIVVEMLFGPCLHMLKNEIVSAHNKILRADLISLIINKWRVVKMEQQMFLVEAVERLIINQDITAMCINLLQEVLEKVRQAHKEGTFSHAFAIVDSKLLALYSSRNSGQLPKEILLLLILVAQVLKTPVMSTSEEDQSTDDEFFIPKPQKGSKTNFLMDEDLIKGSLKSKQKNKSKIGAHSLLVYLKTRSGCIVPHIIYVIEVTNRITLSILCELTSQGVMSGHISTLVRQLNNLLCHPLCRQEVSSFAYLDREFKSLTDLIWKLKTPGKEKHVKKLMAKWDQLKQCEIESFLKFPKQKLTNPRLESGLSSCCEMLKTIFEEFISVACLKYEEKTQFADHQEVFKLIQRVCIRQLKDVSDFLEVKALQNITMASYMSDYPGLIHFIYIDRNTDCMIAPGVALKKTHLNGTTSLKQKIWKMVSFGRKHIDGANKFCTLWKDSDLSFFYHVWFEDSTGRMVKPTANPNLKKLPTKGIICGNYYKKLKEQSFPGASLEHILCYELFCVHLESTPTEVVVEQSKKLSSQLWHFAGAYRTSLDLL